LNVPQDKNNQFSSHSLSSRREELSREISINNDNNKIDENLYEKPILKQNENNMVDILLQKRYK